MKVRMTLEVSDAARAYIAQHVGGGTTQAGMADRDSIVEFFEKLAKSTDEAGVLLTPGKLQENELGDAKEAVTYLRAQGKTESQIRSWLFYQKARFAVAMTAK